MKPLGDNYLDKHRSWPKARVYCISQQPEFMWSGTATILQTGHLAASNIKNHLTTITQSCHSMYAGQVIASFHKAVVQEIAR